MNIEGIITAEFTTASVSYSRAFVQDATGGINIYWTGTHTCFLIGDDVSITGTIAQYGGLTEVMITSCTINSHGNPVPAPLLITIPELNSSFKADYTEPNEGRLVRIDCVTIPGASGNWSSKNWTISDGTTSGILYFYGGAGCAVHPLIGTPVPTGTFDVIGILGQYKSASPYTSGYEIMPRMLSDIIQPGTCGVPIESTTWSMIKTLFR